MFEDPTVDSYVEIDDGEGEECEEDDNDGERVAAEALIRRTLDKWNDPDAMTTVESTARTSVVYSIKTKPFTGKEAYNLLSTILSSLKDKQKVL